MTTSSYVRVLAVVIAGTLAFAACGDDDDSGAGDGEVSAEERGVGDPEREALVEAMVSEGASGQEAVCFIDELGLDDAQRIYGADEDELSDSDMDKAQAAFEKCSEGGGSTEDGDDETASGGGDLADMRACIEDGGLQTTGSSAPTDLDESLGILDTVNVASSTGGTGTISLYSDVDTATEAREASAALEDAGDNITVGQVNDVVYVYNGDSDGLAVIEGCL